MLADLGKILTADRQAQATVTQAQQEALDLKNQADAGVRESQAQLQDELTQVRQTAQADILQEAETRIQEVAAATTRQIQELTENAAAHREEAVVLLVSRVLGS